MSNEDETHILNAVAKAALVEVAEQTCPGTEAIFARYSLDAERPVAGIAGHEDDSWNVLLNLQDQKQHVCVRVEQSGSSFHVVNVHVDHA